MGSERIERNLVVYCLISDTQFTPVHEHKHLFIRKRIQKCGDERMMLSFQLINTVLSIPSVLDVVNDILGYGFLKRRKKFSYIGS